MNTERIRETGLKTIMKRTSPAAMTAFEVGEMPKAAYS